MSGTYISGMSLLALLFALIVAVFVYSLVHDSASFGWKQLVSLAIPSAAAFVALVLIAYKHEKTYNDEKAAQAMVCVTLAPSASACSDIFERTADNVSIRPGSGLISDDKRDVYARLMNARSVALKSGQWTGHMPFGRAEQFTLEGIRVVGDRVQYVLSVDNQYQLINLDFKRVYKNIIRLGGKIDYMSDKTGPMPELAHFVIDGPKSGLEPAETPSVIRWAIKNLWSDE